MGKQTKKKYYQRKIQKRFRCVYSRHSSAVEWWFTICSDRQIYRSTRHTSKLNFPSLTPVLLKITWKKCIFQIAYFLTEGILWKSNKLSNRIGISIDVADRHRVTGTIGRSIKLKYSNFFNAVRHTQQLYVRSLKLCLESTKGKAVEEVVEKVIFD